jgi:hypothetical protein
MQGEATSEVPYVRLLPMCWVQGHRGASVYSEPADGPDAAERTCRLLHAQGYRHLRIYDLDVTRVRQWEPWLHPRGRAESRNG